jgi:hypothetical protein
MSKHTPGPWVVGNQDPLNFGVPRGWGTEPIGFVYGPSFPEHSEVGQRALANARLIAAAPELLEALRSIADCCDEEHAARDYASRQAEIRGIARAAIAKATGEQP